MRQTLFIILILLLVTGCQDTKVTVSKEIDSTTKAEIEKEVRIFWQERRPSEKINGFSHQKFSDSIVLVAVTFENQQTNAINAVARKFENGSNITWKIEPFNDRWKGILRLEPEK